MKSFIGGFLIGWGLLLIVDDWKRAKSEQNWADATDGDRESSEQSG